MTHRNPMGSHANRAKVSSLKELAPHERPRERLLSEGPQSIDHASLISILLGTGRSSDEDALLLARHVLYSLGSLERLANATVEQLCLLKGIGPAKAARLVAAFELANRALVYSRRQDKIGRDLDYGRSLSERLLDILRSTWEQDSPLLIACSIPKIYHSHPIHREDLNVNLSLQHCLDSAITLSLSSTLSDIALHGRWLSTLLLSENELPWIMISLRASHLRKNTDEAATLRLIQLAEEMGLSIHSVVVGSGDPDEFHIHRPSPLLTEPDQR